MDIKVNIIKFWNFISTQDVNKFWWKYFYTLFVYKGNKDDKSSRLMDIRIMELENKRIKDERIKWQKKLNKKVVTEN